MKTLVFTCGDINGIGPEIVIKTINKFYNPEKRKIVFICPANVFEETISFVKPGFLFNVTKRESLEDLESGKVQILDIGDCDINVGQPTIHSGKKASQAITASYELVNSISESVIVTAPISKKAFDLAGIDFPGHTEYYSYLCRSKSYLMTFLSEKMICGLVTIHEPIKNISTLLNKQKIENSISLMLKMLRNDLGFRNPRLAVLGLNPHSGEDGRIGREEIDTIIPSILEFEKENVHGPFVPDAFFGKKMFEKYDAVLGMYHDQVLIPFKLLNFDSGVNYTAGLPIVRTSPDHGTAYDIAGKGIANSSSMISSVDWAENILDNRLKNNA